MILENNCQESEFWFCQVDGSFKTALTKVKKLESQEVITQTRTVRNAIMYQFNMESKQAYHIDKLINEIATRRIKKVIKVKA